MTRLVPKTTSCTATGSCGHAFKPRFPVPFGMQGTPLDQKARDALDDHRESRRVFYSASPCPECMAGLTLEANRRILSDVGATFDMTPPSPMDGPIRQVAFAENVRADRFLSGVTFRVRTVKRAFRAPTVADQVLLSGLRARWPEHDFCSSSVSPDIQDLVDTFRVNLRAYDVGYYHGMDSDPGLNAQACLAAWLVVREGWTDDYVVFDDVRPKVWIARSNRPRPYDRVHPSVSHEVVQAAQITAWVGGWSTRQDAEAFFRLLLRSDSSMATLLAETDRVDTSIYDLAEQALVMDALTVPAYPPF